MGGDCRGGGEYGGCVGGTDGDQGGATQVSVILPSMKLEPPPSSCAPPPQMGLKENPDAVYGRMLDPSQGFERSAEVCTGPATAAVSTSSAT